MNTHSARSKSFYLLLALLLFQGISGIFGGGLLIWDPTGCTLQMPLKLLEGAPFSNYRIPGIILFTVLGIFPLIVCVDFWRRKRWAWWGTLLVSIVLIIWIGVQISMVGYHSEPPLQLVYGMVGIVLLILTQIPSVRTLDKIKK